MIISTKITQNEVLNNQASFNFLKSRKNKMMNVINPKVNFLLLNVQKKIYKLLLPNMI